MCNKDLTGILVEGNHVDLDIFFPTENLSFIWEFKIYQVMLCM